MNPQRLTYADLDRLAGEVLPHRLALSAGGGDTTVLYACQATYSAGTLGLLGTGLLAQPEHSTLTCVPAAVVAEGE
ncbi:hypothetical protein [Actinomadura sp. WMMB 499]|uniref:hypothetical protein n=1 Tax=Actinomadura sp. WMMB 499 TaxID=1219491 RepID=UPI001243FBC2|nr:hypothetical protein [Actinomadura sp. WMMB 499]QFG24434.1 hypothetical protein F7P10_28220 [Actinomadura sp. WMMB 499]